MAQIYKFNKIKYNKKKVKLRRNINKFNPGYNDSVLCETWLQGPDYCPLIEHNLSL
jgi:hypothetical protein